MLAVTFQEAGRVEVTERPEPELDADTSAVVRVSTTGICGSDLHIYHGRVPVEKGFTIGHEFVGTVVDAGDKVTRVAVGDRVVGCFCTACGQCFFCMRGDFHQCKRRRIFGHGETLGNLQGAQAEYVLVPDANMTLRKVPDSISDDAALFAGDVAGTGYNAVAATDFKAGDTFAVVGLGPVGLCAVEAAAAAGASRIIAVDRVEERLEIAKELGAVPVHLEEQHPPAEVKKLTDGNGVDVAADCVGHPDALYMACRLARPGGTVSVTGAYVGHTDVHMGLVWIKALSMRTGPANVVGHVDRVLGMIDRGVINPAPLVSHHMKLIEAEEGYRLFDNREALKVVLTPEA